MKESKKLLKATIRRLTDTANRLSDMLLLEQQMRKQYEHGIYDRNGTIRKQQETIKSLADENAQLQKAIEALKAGPLPDNPCLVRQDFVHY